MNCGQEKHDSSRVSELIELLVSAGYGVQLVHDVVNCDYVALFVDEMEVVRSHDDDFLQNHAHLSQLNN